MKDINGFKNQYAITPDGKVWSYKVNRFLKERGSGKHCKDRRERDYKRTNLYIKGVGHIDYYIHRLVAEHYIPNPLNLKEVNHKNGIKHDNRVENLEWCSPEQNKKHAFVNGFTTRGQKNSQCKLTEQEVYEIRKTHTFGNTSKYNRWDKDRNTGLLAKKYDVTKATITLIISGTNWSYLKN